MMKFINVPHLLRLVLYLKFHDFYYIIVASYKYFQQKQIDVKIEMDNTKNQINSNIESVVPEFPYKPQSPQIRSCQPIYLPPFLFSSTVKVIKSYNIILFNIRIT